MPRRPRSGGSTTQAGVNFQNYIAVLRVADMLAENELDSPLVGRLGRITSVRNEHPVEEVDDTVITYTSGRTEFIQAKSDISRHSLAWRVMWKHFYTQYHSPGFRRGLGKDFMTLVVNYSEPLSELETTLERAARADSYGEWFTHYLNEPGRQWAVNIRDTLNQECQITISDKEFFQLCKHVRVSLSTYEADPQESRSFGSTVYETLKDKFTPAEGIFMLLSGIISAEAPSGTALTSDYLIRKLQDNGISVFTRDKFVIGEFAPLMCDRTTQESQFTAALHQNLTDEREFCPQIYLLPGPLGENHSSLVKRFRYTVVEDYTKARPGILFKEVEEDWPSGLDLTQRRNLLRVQLFKYFDPDYYKKTFDALTPLAFRETILSLKPGFVVIRHQIREWDEHTQELIEWYKQFWNEVKGSSNIPPCLVFLNVVYTPRQLKRLGKLSKKTAPGRSNPILNLIANFSDLPGQPPSPANRRGNCFCVRLDELRCVEPEHVENWFDRFKIHGPGINSRQEIRKIFETESGRLSPCKPMSEVEGGLQDLYRRCIKG